MDTSTLPALGGNPPFWWSQKGVKMEYSAEHSLGRKLMISGSVAWFSIRHDPKDDVFVIEWSTLHWDGQIMGRLTVQHETIELMFGLKNVESNGVFSHLDSPPDAAHQGIFCRSGGHLNVPHPGTGLQGDPNISIYVTPELRTKVLEFLENTASDLV